MKNIRQASKHEFVPLGLIFAVVYNRVYKVVSSAVYKMANRSLLSGTKGFRNMRKLLGYSTKPLLIGLLCVGLLACGEENISDLNEYVQEVKSRKKGRVPELPEVKSYETFAYNQTNLRNPFQPQRASRKARGRNAGGPTPNLKRKREVLEQYPLDTLTMVGSLEQSGERWALIKTQDGTIFRVKRGSYMGQDNGRITNILDSQIELKEIVPDGLGGWIKRKSTLGVNE